MSASQSQRSSQVYTVGVQYNACY